MFQGGVKMAESNGTKAESTDETKTESTTDDTKAESTEPTELEQKIIRQVEVDSNVQRMFLTSP